MKIEVTEEQIYKGKPDCIGNCPIALAASEAIGMKAYAHSGYLHFPDADDMTVELPKEAIIFIRNFDNGLEVAPFSFEVNL